MPGYFINLLENLDKKDKNKNENKKENNEIKYIEYAKLCPYLYFKNLYLSKNKS